MFLLGNSGAPRAFFTSLSPAVFVQRCAYSSLALIPLTPSLQQDFAIKCEKFDAFSQPSWQMDVGGLTFKFHLSQTFRYCHEDRYIHLLWFYSELTAITF